MNNHIYIQAITLEKDAQTGNMVVRAVTNHGRFVIDMESLDSEIVSNFYSWVKETAIEEVEKALAEETTAKTAETLKDRLKEQLQRKASS
jgi:hypothetical protein